MTKFSCCFREMVKIALSAPLRERAAQEAMRRGNSLWSVAQKVRLGRNRGQFYGARDAMNRRLSQANTFRGRSQPASGYHTGLLGEVRGSGAKATGRVERRLGITPT